jgi:fructokinase
VSDTDILIFGEVLFDRFADHVSVLGGAPFNVAWHLQGFGHAPHFCSRIGKDALGQRVVDAMNAWGLSTGNLQTDPDLPTGTVNVTLDDGEPRYEIRRPAAWDAIATSADQATSGVLYHGTLALRDARSRGALEAIRARHTGTVFVDVNLRDPWWNAADVAAQLQDATWVKLNESELSALQPQSTPDDFLQQFGLDGLVLTHGARGAEILTASGERIVAGPTRPVEVVDSVGAGDAFSAVVICGLARGWPLGVCAERAQGFAAEILGHRGATVDDKDFYEAILADWNDRNGDRSTNV